MRKTLVHNSMIRSITLLTTMYCMSLSAFASEPQVTANTLATIDSYASASFNPTRNESITIPINIKDNKNVKEIIVEIRTHDDDLVRTLMVKPLESKKLEDKKKVSKKIKVDKQYQGAIWDGKDDQKQLVPNEAYYLVLVVTDNKDAVTRIDFRNYSGGEEVYEFKKNIVPKAIEYTLPVASRMLVRSGIKNGPMLATIIDWEPRTAGFHTERWNGRDTDDVITIDQNPKVGYLIVGYQLPDHSIITYGNKKETYRAYREQKKWPIKKANYENRLLERGDKLIRTEYYTPVLQQKSPRILVELLDKQSRKPIKKIKGFDEVLAEVKLNTLDEIYLDQERYEISFFVDNEFIAEEEQGFVPFNWRWSPGRFGIKPGAHMLTINVSGYNGQVGVKNIPFTLIAEEEQ
jgi:hypothetical protein